MIDHCTLHTAHIYIAKQHVVYSEHRVERRVQGEDIEQGATELLNPSRGDNEIS